MTSEQESAPKEESKQEEKGHFISLKNIVILGLMNDEFVTYLNDISNLDFSLFVNLVFYLKKSYEDTLQYFFDHNPSSQIDNLFKQLKNFKEFQDEFSNFYDFGKIYNLQELNETEKCNEFYDDFKCLISISDYNPGVFDEVYPVLKQFFTFLKIDFGFEFPYSNQAPFLYYEVDNNKFKHLSISMDVDNDSKQKKDIQLFFKTINDQTKKDFKKLNIGAYNSKAADTIMEKWKEKAENYKKDEVGLLTNPPEEFLLSIFLRLKQL